MIRLVSFLLLSTILVPASRLYGDTLVSKYPFLVTTYDPDRFDIGNDATQTGPVEIPHGLRWCVIPKHFHVDDSDMVELVAAMNATSIPCVILDGALTSHALAKLVDVPSLHLLILEALPAIDDEGFEPISGMTGLESVTFSGTRQQAWRHHERSPLRDQLRSARAFASFSSLANLKELRLREWSLTERGLAGIEKLQRLRSLKLVDRSGSDETPFFPHDGLRHLDGLTGLTALDLSGLQYLGDADAAHVWRLGKLESLAINTRTQASGGPTEEARWNRVVHPHLSAKAFSGIARLSSLRELSLSLDRLPDSAYAILGELAKLESLAIEYPDFSTAALAFLPRLRALRRLSIAHSEKLDDGILRHIAPLEQLEDLTLQDMYLDDAGVAQLAALVHLRRLDLAEQSRLTGRGLRALAKLTALTDLDLTCSHASDETLEALAASTKLRRLRVSGFKLYCTWGRAGNVVTDAGVRHLAALQQLEDLDLSGSEVSDASIPLLLALPRLHRIDLRSTKITRAGAVRLRAKEGLIVHTESSDFEGE